MLDRIIFACKAFKCIILGRPVVYNVTVIHESDTAYISMNSSGGIVADVIFLSV